MQYTTDTGSAWSPIIPVSTNTTEEDKPHMAVDNTGGQYDGNLYVVWTDNDVNDGAIRLQYGRSTDHGTNWAIRSIQIFNPQNNTTGQFAEPHVAPDGTVYIVYYVGPDNQDGTANIEVTKFTSGGATSTPGYSRVMKMIMVK